MKDLFTLENKIALVTGGSMGIGSMIAEGFLHFGAKVYIVSRREEALKAKQFELSKIGPCEYIQADLSNLSGIEKLIQQFSEKESQLDILVNNAGISDGGKEVDDITEEDWDSVMNLNIKTIFFTRTEKLDIHHGF